MLNDKAEIQKLDVELCFAQNIPIDVHSMCIKKKLNYVYDLCQKRHFWKDVCKE